jgi:putative transposase
MVTAATYLQVPIFRSHEGLDLLLGRFHDLAIEHAIALQAWAIFPNHYHFIGVVNSPSGLRSFLRHFHSVTATEINRIDHSLGRRVWFQFWDSCLTYQKSYFARLRYVHENAVHHGLVRLAANYPWCSAGWFERKASRAFRKTILSFPCDKLSVRDDFTVKSEEIAM